MKLKWWHGNNASVDVRCALMLFFLRNNTGLKRSLVMPAASCVRAACGGLRTRNRVRAAKQMHPAARVRAGGRVRASVRALGMGLLADLVCLRGRLLATFLVVIIVRLTMQDAFGGAHTPAY